MGLRDLFKVRKPGNGSEWEAKAKRENKRAMGRKFPSYDRTEVAGKKQPVK